MNIEQELLKAHSTQVATKVTRFLRAWREVDHERFEAKNPGYTSIVGAIVDEMHQIGLDTDEHLSAGGRFIVDQLRHNGYDTTTVTPPWEAVFQANTNRFVVQKKRGRPVGSKKIKTTESAVRV